MEDRVVKRNVVRFYRTDRGKEPVREWLKRLDDDDRKIIGNDLQTLEFAWTIGMRFADRLQISGVFGKFGAG